MTSARAVFFGKLFRLCHKPLIQHVVFRGRRSHAYITNEMRHRSLLFPYAKHHRNKHIEWNYDAEVYAFANRLGEKFEKSILHTALLDRSFVASQIEKEKEAGIEPKEPLEDNTKLADTGKMIQQCVIDRYLRTVLPKFPDDGINGVLNHLTSDEVNLEIAKGLGLDELVLTPEFPVPDDIVLKSFHAVIGAVYESVNLERAAHFVRDFIIVRLSSMEINSMWVPEDPVQCLNSILQNDGHNTPEPRLIHQCGMNTILASYRVGMYLDRRYLGAGNGESVEEAVKMAALDVLWKMWNTTDGRLVLPFNLEASVFLKTTSPIPLLDDAKMHASLQSTSTA